MSKRLLDGEQDSSRALHSTIPRKCLVSFLKLCMRTLTESQRSPMLSIKIQMIDPIARLVRSSGMASKREKRVFLLTSSTVNLNPESNVLSVIKYLLPLILLTC